MTSKRAKDRKDAAKGGILGALIGDATGVSLEFHNGPITPKLIEEVIQVPGGGFWQVAPGQVSDDGEMTICQLRGLSESSDFNIENVARQYVKWFLSNPFDIGITTKSAIGSVLLPEWNAIAQEHGYANAMTRAAAMYNQKSKANGGLMRASGLGVFGHRFSIDAVAQMAKTDSLLSHPNESCCLAASAYCVAVSRLVQGEEPKKVVAAISEWVKSNANSEVNDWLEMVMSNHKPKYSPSIGFLKIAFVEAFRHLWLESDYVEALEETLLGGGDTDTNACIVGGLMGAMIGAQNLPSNMKDAVFNCDTTKGKRLRPDFLHPKHVPALIDKIFAY